MTAVGSILDAPEARTFGRADERLGASFRQHCAEPKPGLARLVLVEGRDVYDGSNMPRGQRNARLMQQALAYADGLYNLALHLSRDTTQAEDLVQETYARALAAAQQFVDGSNLKAWLFRILRNTFIDLYRREQRAPTVDHARAPVANDTAEPAQERAVVGRELEQALLSLHEEARFAVLLDLEGFSEADIAQCLGCAAGTVKSRLFRARAALRERLRDHDK
jgi:RNA polymerase sigma-70 factor (ECF subfamily)